MVGALVAAGSAGAAALATNVVSLGIAQFVCGAAWATVMVSAVVAAFAIGRRRRQGTAVGALFAVIAVATMARTALVTAHGDRIRRWRPPCPGYQACHGWQRRFWWRRSSSGCDG
jgi:MFS family permease